MIANLINEKDKEAPIMNKKLTLGNHFTNLIEH